MEKHERLKLYRKTLGLNQKEFASRLGFGQSSYSPYETGQYEISERIAVLLQEIYSVNPDWLLYGEGEMTISDKVTDDFIEDFKKLSEENQQLILQIAKRLLKSQFDEE